MGNAAPEMDAVPGQGADFSVSHLFYNTFLQSAIAKNVGLRRRKKVGFVMILLLPSQEKGGMIKKKGCFWQESGNFEKEKC